MIRKARDFIGRFYQHVPVLDSGARAATVTFAKRGLGDVLVSWENEAYLASDEFGKDEFDVVYPPTSILAEPPVAVVDKVVDKRGTRAVAEAYLKFLFTEPAQEIAAKNHYRPTLDAVAQKHAAEFPQIEAVHHCGCIWRMAEGAEDAFCRRRRVRPDL